MLKKLPTPLELPGTAEATCTDERGPEAGVVLPVDVTVAAMKEDVASNDQGAPAQSSSVAESDTVQQLGAVLAPVNEETRQKFGISRTRRV